MTSAEIPEVGAGSGNSARIVIDGPARFVRALVRSTDSISDQIVTVRTNADKPAWINRDRTINRVGIRASTYISPIIYTNRWFRAITQNNITSVSAPRIDRATQTLQCRRGSKSDNVRPR